MQARDCRERVIRLKKWRVDNAKTVEECIELCGDFPSDSTIKKILGKGGEDKPYRESTIAAIEKALIGEVYNAQIKIPVEDVIKAQKAMAEDFAETKRKQVAVITKQKAEVRVRDAVICILVIYDIAMLIYDRLMDTTGFYNAHSATVWFVQVAIAMSIATVCSIYLLRKKLYTRHEQEKEP